MEKNSFKTILLNFVWLVSCFIFSSSINCFAQKNKELKKDSVLQKKYKLKNEKKIEFNGTDGPYIIRDTLYRINSRNELIISSNFKRDSVKVFIDNKSEDEFFVSLESNYEIPKMVYSLPEKMIVISDIEGNYNAFVSFLFSNNVIDKEHNWIYGKGHLVLVGDFVDRGKNVTQVLWLIYKLEHQAKKQGGLVHYILGNHEILNFHGDHKYNRGKYIKAAQEISQLEDQKEAIKFLYSKHSELGKWLATKNVIEKIGDYLFVHAGLSPELLDYKLSIEDINNIVRSNFNSQKNPTEKTLDFLYGPKGPFWYRGLVKSRLQYDKIYHLQLEAVLKYYRAEKIVVGHTPVKDISSDFNDKVIRTDVMHGHKKCSGKTKGLLIENGKDYIINDQCSKKPLKQKL